MQDSESPPRITRIGGARRGRRVASPAGVPDVTRRLATLEKQVEEALSTDGRSSAFLPSIESVVDAMLDAYNRLRRAASGERQATAELIEAPLDLLYRWWWRVDVIGRERLPRRGPVVVVANRAGTLLPYEAFMLTRALRGTSSGARAVRPLVDDWILRLPVLGAAAAALGAVPPTASSLRRTLDAGEIAITFPEGGRAIAKPLAQRYRLTSFGRGSWLRVAVEAGAAIVPVAVIGAEEVHPVLWRIERLGRLLGLPAVPVTPAIVPLPTKWTIHVGEPVDMHGRGDADAQAMRRLGTRVRERLQGLVSDGLGRRRGLFV